MINTIFFGTHEFAATILQGILSNPLFNVELVITQPDRPVGRHQELQKSPVKLLAEKYNLKIEQPPSLKDFRLKTFDFRLDLNIVAQYGLIIPKSIIEAPKYGTINVHTSLLPKYRGASPIQHVLMNGEKQTGVTIMQMDEGLDTGPILLQKKLSIDDNDTYLTLDKKLAPLGIEALNETIPQYIIGELKPTLQDNSLATVCKQLDRENGKIDWKKTNDEIYNLYRGLSPWPGIWTIWNSKRLKLLKINKNNLNINSGEVNINNDKIFIGCSTGSVEILELQLEGKKVMNVKEFINGFKNIDKQILI